MPPATASRVIEGVFGSQSVSAGTNYYVSQSLAMLTVRLPNNEVWLGGLNGREYEILGTNTLTATDWPVLDRVTLTTSPQLWTDPFPWSATNGARFYRARLVP